MKIKEMLAHIGNHNPVFGCMLVLIITLLMLAVILCSTGKGENK